MNGYLRVNTFLRDVAFINCQDIKTIYFHVNYFEEHKKRKNQAIIILIRESLPLLRDESTRHYKKLLGNDWNNFRYGAIMNSYVTAWEVYDDTAEKVLIVYATNNIRSGKK